MKPCLHSSMRGKPLGFSLLEVVIAIALIALLATIAITQIGNVFSGGQESVAKLFVDETLELPLFKYRSDTGNYPNTAEGIKALLNPPGAKEGVWRGPYIKKLPKDPWKKEYNYRFPGQKNPSSYDLWSSGPDEISNNGDDIGNWE